MVGSVQWVDPDNSGPIVPTLQDTNGRPTVASPPTSMYWTMSLRDAETVYARKQGNIEKLQIAGLTPTQNAGRISFSDAQGPVRLASLLSLKREVTEVMQHIALFAGRRVAGIGGASEELVLATVLHGDEAPVPEDVDFVRIVHFETPSPATRWPPDHAIDPRYRAAVFNRVAMADTLVGRSVTFVLEPIATTDVYRSDIRQIDVSLNHKGAKEPIDLSIAPQQRKPIATIILRLLPAEGKVAAQIIYDGEKSIETFDVANPDLAALLEAPLIYLSVTGMQFHSVGVAAPNEMWWHGSLLVDQLPEPKVAPAPARVPRDDRQVVNFDWFFTPPESDPTKAISLSGLEQLRQAQARIISVSRRIAVVKG
jgi:hypothetical protein